MVKNEEMPGCFKWRSNLCFKWRSNLNIKPMIFSREAEKAPKLLAGAGPCGKQDLANPINQHYL
jgi:hypothetical protein